MMDGLPKYALSIRQPWAWAIIHAGKDIENRDWSTKFRGPVCIHAAKGMTGAEFEDFNMTLRGVSRIRPSYLPPKCEFPLADNLKRGGIIGTAEIVDCVDASDSPWFFGRYGFVLRNAQPVDFIPCRGALWFFKWGIA